MDHDLPPTNWAGNQRWSAARRHRPADLDELRRTVAGADRVRVLGSGHSFNAVVDTPGDLVSLAGMPTGVEVDAAARRVRVGGGVTYATLGRALVEHGLALPNTGSLPHITVAGACATGTHGSGTGNQALAAAVVSMRVVTATGDLLTLDAASAGEDWPGCVVSLGRLGVVVDLDLAVVDGFEVAQTVVEGVRDEDLGDVLDEVLRAAYSVSVFTRVDPQGTSQVWLKEKVGRPGGWDGAPLWGGRPAETQQHPLLGSPPEWTTPQGGVPGSWFDRLYHFREDFEPSSGDELQSELLLPLAHAGEAWRALLAARDRFAHAVQVCELRAVAADPMWLGLTGGVDAAAFHVTWVRDPEVVMPALAAVEEALAPWSPRPHWGKLSALAPVDLAARFPRMRDFADLVRRLDPEGCFASDLVDGWLDAAR